MVKKEKSPIIKLPKSKEKRSKLDDKWERSSEQLNKMKFDTHEDYPGISYSTIDEHLENTSASYNIVLLSTLFRKGKVNTLELEIDLLQRQGERFNFDAYRNACRTIKRYCV